MTRSGRLWSALLLAAGVAFAQRAPSSSDAPASVEGSVTNEVTGEPVVRARVRLHGYAQGEARTFVVLTNDKGKFSITGLPAGTSYMPSVERAGFVRDASGWPRNDVQLRAGEKKTDLDLKLTPCGSISGRVVDAQSEPRESVTVMAEGPGITKSGNTDEDGQFRTGGLPPGKYRIRATLGYTGLPPEIRTDGTEEVHYGTTFYPTVSDRKSAARIQVAPGAEVTGIEIELVRAPILRVSGTVRGIPPGARNVSIETRQGFTSSSRAVKADGSFALWRLDPGRYSLSASWRRPGNEVFRSAAVDIEVVNSHIDNIDLTIVPPSDLAGRVEFEDEQANPQMPKGMERRLVLEDLGMRPGPEPALVAPDGSFVIEKVSPGRFRVRATWGPVHVKSMRLGKIEIESDILDLRSRPPGAELVIILSSATGELGGAVRAGIDPAPGAVIALGRDDSDRWEPISSTVAGPDGTYSFGRLPAGRYRIVAFEAGQNRPYHPAQFEEFAHMTEKVEVRAGEKTTRDLKLHSEVEERQ